MYSPRMIMQHGSWVVMGRHGGLVDAQVALESQEYRAIGDCAVSLAGKGLICCAHAAPTSPVERDEARGGRAPSPGSMLWMRITM